MNIETILCMLKKDVEIPIPFSTEKMEKDSMGYAQGCALGTVHSGACGICGVCGACGACGACGPCRR